MSKSKSNKKPNYYCTNCGNMQMKWSGKCEECNAWGSITEEMVNNSEVAVNKGNIQKLDILDDNIKEYQRIKCQIEELNRVVGGGFVPGSAILIGGDPGVGKSTLLLQLVVSLSKNNQPCLYITGEESISQVKLRAKRLDLQNDNTHIISSTNIEDILSTIDHHKKSLKLVVIDSIQTMMSSEVASTPGTVSQIKNISHKLINYAKQNNIIMVIVCHVNKEGQLAGPKLLEHMVDTVLYFEGDHNNHFRIIRSIKNRFGAVNEIGVFEMSSNGLNEISNPSELFLMERDNNVSGNCVFAGIEGSRPLLVEVQALITPTNMATPRRAVVGWDHNRLSMIIAVLATRFGMNLANFEVYLTIAGGLKVSEPAIDLAVCAALISAAKNIALPKNSVFFGEIGLSGEVRKVTQTEQRIGEAKKLGFDNLYCNVSEDKFDDKAKIHNIKHIMQLKNLLVT